MVTMAPAFNCPTIPETGIVARQSDGANFVMLGGQFHLIPDNLTLRTLWPNAPTSPTILSDLCIQVVGQGSDLPSAQSATLAQLVALVNTWTAQAMIAPAPAPQPFASGANVGLTQPTSTRPGLVGTLQTDFSNVTSTLQAHETAILVGAGVFAAWRLGLFRALLGRRHRY